MVIIWRILLIVSLGFLGFLAGMWLGGTFFVPRGSGLAGGPMVIGYGLLGTIILLIIGGIAAFRLSGTALRNLALVSIFGALMAGGVLAYLIMSKISAGREPDAAFKPAGQFTAVMERLDTSDPYLFVKMQVDSRRRAWTQTGPAPKHQVCSAQMKAKKLVDMRTALNKLAAMSSEDFAACRKASGPAIKRLSWNLLDAKQGLFPKGKLDITEICAREHYAIARALALVEGASRGQSSRVKCQ